MPINYRFRSFLEVCHIGVTMAVRVRLNFVALIHMVNTNWPFSIYSLEEWKCKYLIQYDQSQMFGRKNRISNTSFGQLCLKEEGES